MSDSKTAVIVGATGTVGRGIVRTLSQAGWSVVAVARDERKLASLAQSVPGLITITGSVENDATAEALAAKVTAATPHIDAVVTALNMPLFTTRLLDCPSEKLIEVFQGNLITHLCAARALIPLITPGGRYVGIGGGMADFTFEGVGPVSMCQAAQRNMFRFFAMETQAQDISVVELMLFSHIVDPADEETANPREIRADEVGEHVRVVLEQPDDFPGPILALKSRKQIGKPERP
jgi:NAD(P)-dependent dehydrogenase (short-subunit alcohol dehydrogenase family)